jgi:hypothetical protein
MNAHLIESFVYYVYYNAFIAPISKELFSLLYFIS